MSEKPLVLDDISVLWAPPRDGLVPGSSCEHHGPATNDDRGHPAGRVPGAAGSQRAASEARLERVVAQLGYRVDALAREMTVLAAATKEQTDRLVALEECVRESMLLVASAIERPVRR